MSWTPTDEQVEKAVETFRDNYSFRQHDAEWIARAVLVAVGPMIAADAWDEAAEVAAKHGSRWFSNPYKRQEAGR